MKKQGSGWKGESRRHSLARKGVKTVLPDGRRFDVSKFVANGKRDWIDDVDVRYRVDNTDYDEVTIKIANLIDKYTNKLEEGLFDQGFTRDEVDEMQIRSYIIEEVYDMLSSFQLTFSFKGKEDLLEWIQDRIEISPHLNKRDLIDRIEIKAERGMQEEISGLYKSEIQDIIDSNIEKTRAYLNLALFTDDEIDEMLIDEWQINVFYDKLDKAVANYPEYFTQPTDLDTWIDNVVGWDELKASGKRKHIPSNEHHNLTFPDEVWENWNPTEQKVSKLMQKENIDPEYASPNFVHAFAQNRGINLTSDEVVSISNNYSLKRRRD